MARLKLKSLEQAPSSDHQEKPWDWLLPSHQARTGTPERQSIPPTDPGESAEPGRDGTMLLGRGAEIEVLARVIGQVRAGGQRSAGHSGRSRYRKDRLAQ